MPPRPAHSPQRRYWRSHVTCQDSGTWRPRRRKRGFLIMFRLSTTPKICRFAGIEVGGQPGERPPLLIANMFQTGDKLFISRKDFNFDREKAKARLKELEEISAHTGIPAMVGMVAPKGYDEMRVSTEFFLENSSLPFAVDTWTEKARLETARFIADQGLQDRR